MEYLVLRKCKLMAGLWPAGLNSNAGSYLDADNIHGNKSRAFEDVLPEIMALQGKINEAKREIKLIDDTIEKIENEIRGVDSLDDKVRYLRDYIGYSLYEISKKLGYSHDYIREISARMKKRDIEKHLN